MSLNIKSRERRIGWPESLPGSPGESLTKAVTEAIRERLERERRRRKADVLSAELLEIGRRCAAHVRQPAHTSAHGGILYDARDCRMVGEALANSLLPGAPLLRPGARLGRA